MRGCGAPPVATARSHRIGDQFVEAHAGIDDAVDERRVGAVLEQAPHEIREQRLVRADRRVDAAGPAEFRIAHDLVVHGLAHAVQALELVVGVARQRVDRRDRVRVVGRELREERIRRGEHRARAREVRHVGVRLAREHRIVGEAVDLRALDLRVPVGALDQPHHQPAALRAARVRPASRSRRAPASGTPARRSPGRASPASAARRARRGEEVERQLEAIRFLGIDVEPDVVAARQLRERLPPAAGVRASRARAAAARSADAAPRA